MVDTFDKWLEENFGWLDKKYADGEQITLKDRLHALRQMPIECTPRQRKDIEGFLQKILFRLERNYTPTLDLLAYNILTVFAPVCRESPEKSDEYLKKYEKATAEHKAEREKVFNSNFTPSK